MSDQVTLITEDMAAHWAGRPGSTIRRWAAEGRIRRFGEGRGKVRYNLWELNKAPRDEYTGELLEPGKPPPLPEGVRAA
ncbi:DNA-binding protein [Streptomyces sp. NPDC014801]|uniref:DNA-binding protein n=1 Tax=Streptomyces sp. NPDC014801 TaxID=3364916 RepID=UPI0036FE52B0